MRFRSCRIQRKPEGRAHLRSAVRVEPLHELSRMTHVAGVGENALMVERSRRRVEFDDVEPVVGGETVERVPECLFCLRDRIAVHRPRRVHDEDQFPRH